MSALVIPMPAHPATFNAARAAITQRAIANASCDARRKRAVAVAYAQLRAGASVAWAVTQGQRELRGAEPAQRPGGAA